MKIRITKLLGFTLPLAMVLLPALPGWQGALRAQSTSPKQFAASYLTSREGLPQNSAYDMLQDEFGFVWIATQTGIARFDGRSFIDFSFSSLSAPLNGQMRGEPFLCEQTVLCEDTARKVIWVGTCKGLFSIGTLNGQAQKFLPAVEPGFRQLALDPNGDLVAGTDSGTFRVHPSADLAKGDWVKSGEAEFEDQLLVLQLGAERLGIFSMGGEDLFLGVKAEAAGVRAACLRPLGSGQGREIWIADRDSVYVFDQNGGLLSTIAQRGVNCFKPLSLSGLEGHVALGTEYDGLVVVGPDHRIQAFDQKSAFNWPGMLRGNQVRSFMTTRDGALWIGTRGMGVTRVMERLQLFAHHYQQVDTPGRIRNSMVWAIWRESQVSRKVWLGTEGNGLALYDLDRAAPMAFFDVYPSPDRNIVRAIASANDTLWLGGKAGLHYLIWNASSPVAQRVWTDDSAAVVSMWYEAGARRLWMGTEGGRLMVMAAGKTRHLELPQNGLVTFIGPGSGDSLMVATDRGFVQFPAGKPLDETRHGQVFLDGEHIKCLLPGRDSTYAWAGTAGSGMIRLLRTANGISSRQYLESEGLPDRVIYGILRSASGALWLSTNRGLSCFYPQVGIFINYDEPDGLQHPEFNTGAFFKSGNVMHFGGVNGFNLFQDHIAAGASSSNNPYLPQIALAYFLADTAGKDEKMILFNSPLEGDPAIRLDFDYQYIDCRIVSLAYQDFAKVKFKYRLYPEGSPAPTWTLLKDSPGFTLSQGKGLSSGWFFSRRYILEVWASDLSGGLGLGENQGRSLRIVLSVKPPYWQTWWFILSILLVSLVILVLAFNLYRQNSRLLTRNTDLQTAYHNTAALADLNVIGQKIVASLSLEENFEAIMEEIRDLSDLRSDVFAVDLLDEEAKLLESRLSIEAGHRLGHYSVSLDDPNSLGVACVRLAQQGDAYQGGKYADGFLINDLGDRSQFPFLKGEPGVQKGRPAMATLFVPLRVGERVLGAITVQSYLPDVYRDYHLNMLQILGAYIAIAIDHARTTEALLEAERAHTRAEQEDLIKALDIKLLRSQLSPHFIFNSLGTIQFLVSDGDPRADEYTAKLGEIMREVMTMITRSDISLKTEADFLRDYVEAEKIRFRNEYEFRWRLDIDPALDQDSVFIPPMLLQPFIENSLEHAFYPLPEDGPEIRVYFGKLDDRLVIVVEDNGIGLEQSRKRKSGTHPRKNSTALQNIRRRAELINQLNQDQEQQMTILELDLATEPEQKIHRVEAWDLPVLRHGARFEMHLPLSFKFTATTLND